MTHRKSITSIRGIRLTPLVTIVMVMLSMVVCAFQANNVNGSLPNEYQLKAAFVYQFALFVDWPDEVFPHKDSPIVIGIVGSDPLGPEIERAVQDKRASGRSFVVRRLGVEPALKECQMIYVSTSEMRRLDQLREVIKDAPILTVGDSNGFARDGGIINFIIENGKIRFQINEQAAKRARLNISSQLLKLARIVS